MASLVRTTEFAKAIAGTDPAKDGVADKAVLPAKASASIFINPNLMLITSIPKSGCGPIFIQDLLKKNA
ncbi:hypothetical protein [uncultured Sphingorhabdus sp.]|uniref:hypothetical protein n=1 Tax=uncultured Sphingorhabdus sp. TaxID=1686106 RepID=UPI002633F75C|nr:hypothetical protein [uncultured Sphingorhabdus sp.]HMS21784.1 hypothetical protein [Sphingorhabdus sp.]